MTVQTPLMQQYREIKGRHQDAILFFRMGEFYEMFYDDAEVAPRVSGLTRSPRGTTAARPVRALAGNSRARLWPRHRRRPVTQGFRVAICEQVEEPEVGWAGIVKRAVVETITTGAVLADDLL